MSTEKVGADRAALDAAGEESLGEALPQLGRRIAQMRHRRRWSQSELGRRLGVPRERVSHWERGLHEPSLTALLKLGRELDVSLEELLTGKTAPASVLSPEKKDKALSCIATLVRLLRLSGDADGAAAPKEKRS